MLISFTSVLIYFFELFSAITLELSAKFSSVEDRESISTSSILFSTGCFVTYIGSIWKGTAVSTVPVNPDLWRLLLNSVIDLFTKDDFFFFFFLLFFLDANGENSGDFYGSAVFKDESIRLTMTNGVC